VERLAADEHVVDVPCLERLDIRERDVFAKADESPMQTCFAATGTRPSPARSVTFHPLSFTTQSTNAPTASGSDFSIAIAEILRVP
jgi:hypothetical protein